MPTDSGIQRLPRVVAVSLTVALACGCDAWVSVDERLERAGDAMATGDYVAAMAETKTALEKEPGRADARLSLAEVLLMLGDADAARAEFDRAINLGAEAADHQNLHYRILAGEGKHQERLEAIAADEGLPPQQKLRLQAESEIAIGQSARALETIRIARQRDAEDDEAAFVEVRALWAAGHQQDAIALLDRLLERQSGHARWWLYRGRYGLSLGQAEVGRNAFLKARQADQATLDFKEQLAAIAGLVESNLAAGDLDGAEQAVTQLDRRAPGAFGTLFLRGRVALARRDYNAATAELQKSLIAQPEVPVARLLLGAALLHQGALEQAEAELSRLLAEQPDNADARNVLARVYLARNDVEGARQILSAAPPGTGSNAGTHWILGSLLLRTGQSTEAISLLEASAAADPENVEVQLDLVRAYLATGQRDKAGRLLTSMPDDRGGFERRHLTVLTATRGREPAEAERRVTALVADRPEDAGTQIAAGAYFLGIGDNQAATAAFQRAASIEPGNADARLGLAAIAMQLGDLAGADAELQKARAVHGSDERVLLALADVAQWRRDPSAARSWLEQAIGANPAAVEPRLRLAELSFAGQDAQRAESLLEQALAVTRYPPSVHARIGAIYVRQANYDRALVHFNEAAARGLAGAAMDAVRALIALGREDEARSRLEQENRLDPRAPMPVAMLATLDASDGHLDRALNRVAAFERAGGQRASAAEMRGDLYVSAGQHAKAADAYSQAAAGRSSELLAIKEYFARVAINDAAAESVLISWLERNPRSSKIHYLLGERYHRLGQRAAAIAAYERVLQDGPHALALNNLSLLYQENGDRRSVAIAKRAHELSPGNPAIADTYGWILVQQGSNAEGLAILEAAHKSAPSQPDIRFHYAAAQAQAGRKNEAIANLRALLDAAPQFDSRAEAQSLLATLGGS